MDMHISVNARFQNLGTYVTSQGLEDLEGCEHFFSGSNALHQALNMQAGFTNTKLSQIT